MKYIFLFSMTLFTGFLFGQQQPQTLKAGEKNATVSITPEILWSLDRVSGVGISKDGNNVIYKVSTPKMEDNSFSSRYFMIPLQGGQPKDIDKLDNYILSKNISPDGKYKLDHKEVLVDKIKGSDLYPDLKKSNVLVYNELGHRHWDKWTEGKYNHVFFSPTAEGTDMTTDIMNNEPFHCPQQPFGGDEDYIWHPDGKSIIYVCKKKRGTEAMQSTNTDIYQYFLESAEHKNLTASNKGYDTHPLFSKQGNLGYLSMKTDGNEADKQDIVVVVGGKTTNLTKSWDGTVNQFIWSEVGDKIYFTAPIDGTVQIFSVGIPSGSKPASKVEQITKGDWDITSFTGISGDNLIVARTDMNTAPELYNYDVKTGVWKQITFVNTPKYNLISKSKTERRYVTTTDNKQMLVWVIYPPDFDPKKKYPTLLYCQGGPQSALSQFYSFRWNFQLMAAQGYIVVAPNRRGMPGFGVEWNKQISTDWGGQNIQDYLSAIDAVSKESFVDKKRRGAIGASYGGYSVFYLAGIHEGRFNSFISHCGVFNTQSMYGSTEEIFFVNNDFGGPYWDKKHSRAYTDFNPATRVDKWKTPILIFHGEKDFRIPVTQGLEAFSAAQIRGVKSRLINLPDENHWVMKPQNGLLWQREFFKWLKETL